MTISSPYTRPKAIQTKRFPSYLVVVFFMLLTIDGWTQPGILDRQFSLPRQQTTIYDALNQLSKESSYFFIYDSDLINNDQRIRIPKATNSLETWLAIILNDATLDYKIIESHILIYQPQEIATTDTTAAGPKRESPDQIFLSGKVVDQETGKPLPYASIVIPEKGLGVASNADGLFHIRISDDLLQEDIKVSYMGFKSQVLPVRLLLGNHVDIILESDYISMQEVIIRHYDPDEIIRKALEKRVQNYANEPAYHVSFYREGVIYNKKLLNYSEAIFKIFKSAYDKPFQVDQVMLLKSRNISNIDFADTLIMKIKAGVQSALELDIMKSIPPFLDLEFLDEVEFSQADLVTRDSKMVYAIKFEQTNTDYIPIFSGMIYVDTESLAILKADFEVDPKHINKSKHLFIVKKSRKYQLNFDRINYTVNYQYHNGSYHLSHVRGELKVKVRPRNRLFSKSYQAFLEMAVSHIDEEQVERFSRSETMKTNITFAEHDFDYDEPFWGEYNIIPPEQHLNESLSQIRAKIESMIPEE